MKRFDRMSIRGVVFAVLGLAGIAYELLSSRRAELWVIGMYGFIVCLGLGLIFFVKDR